MSGLVVFEMPWLTPPLRSNDRLHWRAKAARISAIRADTFWNARSLGHSIAGPVIVTLVWQVTDNRRRDVGASSPTLKAALDGIVDACVLVADDHRVVIEERCRIEVGTRRGVRIEIQQVLA